MPSRTTSEVENLPTADTGEPDDLLYLLVRHRKYGFRKMEGIEILPNRFVGKPLSRA
jgi:hypothetical protein